MKNVSAAIGMHIYARQCYLAKKLHGGSLLMMNGGRSAGRSQNEFSAANVLFQGITPIWLPLLELEHLGALRHANCEQVPLYIFVHAETTTARDPKQGCYTVLMFLDVPRV